MVETLIGPFQSSPMSIIPKSGQANTYCILQNYSFTSNPSPAFPNPSINSTINSSDFPTTWGTFIVTSLMLTCLPPNSEIATRDISEAYHMAPTHYTQWPTTVIHTGEDTAPTQQSVLGQSHQVGAMVTCVTHRPPSSGHKVSTQSSHGLMTTFLLEFQPDSSALTTIPEPRHMQTSPNRKTHMVWQKNLRRWHPRQTHWRLSFPPPGFIKIFHQVTTWTRIHLQFWQHRHCNWVFPGKGPKTQLSHHQQSTPASCGTSPQCGSPSPQWRRKNTWLQSMNGRCPKPTPSTKSKNCIETYSTLAQSSQEAALFSPNWRPCWGSLLQILSTQFLPPKTSQMTSNGGSPSSSNLTSATPSPHQSHSLMLARSLMRALALVLPWLLWTNGVH